ncbi:GNAT family N-acetyltransferase [Limimaricola sp.]|uniref:GNAT family N-acetyltransferase n=1 Tax=Limimaricola sp. TaxID=2211665 RepID=UPI00405A0391
MTTFPIEIRAAEPADAHALTAMTNLPGVRHGTLQLPYVPQARLERRLATETDDHFLVGEIEDADGVRRIVAHGGLLPRKRRRAHVGEVVLIVHDDHVGRGYGTSLLRALLDLADNWLGLRRLELEVNADNRAAIRLYERHGFEVEGTKRGDVLRAGVLIDSHVMGRLRDTPRRDKIRTGGSI